MRKLKFISIFLVLLFTIHCEQNKKRVLPITNLVQSSVSSSATFGGGSVSEESNSSGVTLITEDTNSSGSTSGTNSSENTTSTNSSESTGSSSLTDGTTSTNSNDGTSTAGSNETTSSTGSSSGGTDSGQTGTDSGTASSGSTDSSSSSSGSTSGSTGGNSSQPIQFEPIVTVNLESNTNSVVSVNGYITDNAGNTIGNANVIISGTNSNGQTVTVFTGTSDSNGLLTGNFSIPEGVTDLSLVLIIGENTSIPVTIPISIGEACKGDNDRGHGNDLDGIDEDNPGKSTGVNANAMENRKANEKRNRKCTSSLKFLSQIGNIKLPIEKSLLAFTNQSESMFANFISKYNRVNSAIVFFVFAFSGASIYLRPKFSVS